MSEHNYWTFKEVDKHEWENEAFPTREEAIEAGKLACEDDFTIAQLKLNGPVYAITNIETINAE